MQTIPTCSRWQTARAVFRNAERRVSSSGRTYAQLARQPVAPHEPAPSSSGADNTPSASSSRPPPFTPPKPITDVLVERTRQGGVGLLSGPYVYPRKAPPRPIPRPLNAPPSDKLLEKLQALLSRRTKIWAKQKTVHARLRSFGVPVSHISVLLNAFAKASESNTALNTTIYGEPEQLELWEDLSNNSSPEGIDRAVSRAFFSWLRHPATAGTLHEQYAPTVTQMQQLAATADCSHPHEEYVMARSIHRKIIMHVGPTNSGKTHNALRALAAAPRGVYAGPLRLLAHEIWERLNKGQIIPLGVDPHADVDAEPDMDSAMDVGPAGAAMRKTGSSRYARPCNMITGEEQRVVDDMAGLIACTVEMTNVDRRIDVAVIDEIQLIADPQRGGAWTKAVLGTPATELHLCGEETAVPIIEQLVKETGDELIVHRYQRLSPLRVANTSLKGNLKNIQKGDCIVTFSRSSIFDFKRRVETETGLRCAVVYGALPPELRSEQAALFNDPNSGYDVLIGSDALGMGLNLKIRRMILSATSKWNGKHDEPLSVSMIKQIAGRAGRYGLHSGTDADAGVAMTLFDEDMPVLAAALSAPMTPLRYARLGDSSEVLARIMGDLPGAAGAAAALTVFDHVTMTRPPYKVMDNRSRIPVAELVDARGGDLGLAERFMLVNAPVNLRDPRVADGMAGFVRAYRASLHVEVANALAPGGLLGHLRDVLQAKAAGRRARVDALPPLESLHKLASAYAWLAFRNPIAWPDMAAAQAIRADAEAAMTFCLESNIEEGKVRSRFSRNVQNVGREKGAAGAAKPVFARYVKAQGRERSAS